LDRAVLDLLARDEVAATAVPPDATTNAMNATTMDGLGRSERTFFKTSSLMNRLGARSRAQGE
jgi:hypothetical protein